MTLPNHIAGGIVFTGVFGGIAGINILQSPGLLITTVVGATIADMDLPHSLWGRVFGPVSRAINRHFGHRTITHSLLFMGVLGIVATTICRVLEVEAPYPTVLLISFFSHLLFDMMTIQGVPIFYPYRKNPCVIPADPNMRFNSANRRSELILFTFFVASGVFMQPLMTDGFWTTYNRAFGTIQHLQSEFEKSSDLLLARYRYREASNVYEDAGYVVEASGEQAVLWDEQRGWRLLDGRPTSLQTILEVIPEHTGKRFEIKRESFVNVTEDSLESILGAAVVYEVELRANRPFTALYEAEGRSERSTGEELSIRLVDHVDLEVVEQRRSAKAPEAPVRYQASPRIRTLEASIRKLQRRAAAELEAYDAHHAHLENLRSQLDAETDIYEVTRLQKEYQEVKNKRVEKSDYAEEMAELRQQIREVKQGDDLRYQDRLDAAAAKSCATAATTEEPLGPLRLTGILTKVEFTSADLTMN